MEFYDRLNELVDKFYGNIPERVFDEKVLELLESFLARNDESTEWLVVHYEGSADHLYDLVIFDDDSAELNDQDHVRVVIEMAEKEINLFEKYGFYVEADRMTADLATAKHGIWMMKGWC